MRRQAVSLEQLADRRNLVLATWKAARGKHDRPAVARFLGAIDSRLDALAAAIRAGRAPLGRWRRFIVHDPKRRVIHAACFADRVLHHAILNLCEARFERALVDSTFACRPGKGVHAAIRHVRRALQRHEWFVQVDVDAYFASIDHAVLKALLARRFKGEPFLSLLGRIVDGGPVAGAGRGLPIGALTSQHFANAYLDGADRFLLADPRVRAHVRYMDDIAWWCDSRGDAAATLTALREYLASLRLALKPGVIVRPSARGLAYCGFRVRPGLVRPTARKMTRYRAAARRLRHAAERTLAPEAVLQRAYAGAHGALAHTESRRFRRRVWWPDVDPAT